MFALARDMLTDESSLLTDIDPGAPATPLPGSHPPGRGGSGEIGWVDPEEPHPQPLSLCAGRGEPTGDLGRSHRALAR